MKKIIFMLTTFLVCTSIASAAEKAIFVDREWESSPWAAYQVVQKISGFNHAIVLLGQPGTEKNLDYFINLAHWRGIRVSIGLNVADGKDAIFRPGYSAQIASAIAAYASKYNADGINLDFVRTGYSHGLCMTDYCRADFEEKYGINIDAVKADVDYNGWFSKYRPILTEWSGHYVTKSVAAIRDAVKAIKPNMEISVDSVAHPVWEMEGALPVQWIQAGLVDHFYHMDYGDLIDLDMIKKYVTLPNDRFTVAIGNFYKFNHSTWIDMYSRDQKHVDALIKSLEGIGDGYAIYSYRFIR